MGPLGMRSRSVDRCGGGASAHAVRLAWPASVAFCAVFRAVVLVTLFVLAVHEGAVALDFRQFYWAVEVVRGGGSPYGWPLTDWGGPYPYPPLPALVAIPLTGLPVEAAGLVVMVLVAAAAVGSLYVLGV